MLVVFVYVPWLDCLQEVQVYSAGGGREIVKVLVGNKIDKVRPFAVDAE